MRIQTLRWLAQLVAGAVLLLPALVAAQTGDAQFPKERLDQLTAQIALYPDSLLAQVLMAATYPDDVAEAAKWSRANSEQKGDDAVKMVESQPWDPSVQSLVAFPQVIIMMGEKPDWVRDLGDAFLAQPEDVMDSVQRLRAQAQQAGNLKSNEQVKVSTQPAEPRETQTAVVRQSAPPPQVIVIEQTQPQVVYVPSYNPTYVYGAWAYPAYPPYYIPYPPGYWFSGFVAGAVTAGIAWGVGVGISNALWGGCNWGRGDVNINVNRYNNINVNNRIDANNNKWSHNVQNRKATPYRGGDATRAKLDRKYQANQREQFRGRDADRARATQTMQNRGVTMDRGSAMDRARAMDRAGVPDRMQAQNRAGTGSRDLNRDGSGNRDFNRGGAGARDFDRNAARDRAQAVDRQAIQSKAKLQNRDNALHGAGDRQARQTMDRGAASRQSMQANRGASARPQMQRGGGNARPQMQGGGGGGGRPQIQRGGGGGGGARAAGGGGARGGGGGGHGRGR